MGCNPLLSSRILVFQVFDFWAMGLPSPWIRGVTLFLYFTLLQETLLHTCRRKAILQILQMKSLKPGMSALFALFHTQMWDRRACVLNTSGSFHTKYESRCPPQDISISITFDCLLCCYMISVSFFFLFPAFMWDFPSLFWPLPLWLWQWPAGSFWTAWSCFIFLRCHCYLPL